MHSLRHFYASWCINRKEDGGLGLPLKSGADTVRTRDHGDDCRHVFGHLFPSESEHDELAEAEKALGLFVA